MFRHNQPPPEDDPPDLVRSCLDATIGISYNGLRTHQKYEQWTDQIFAADYPFFVAARVRQSTISHAAQNTPFDPMDLTVSADYKQDEWDSRNDDCIVEITQVYLRPDISSMSEFFAIIYPRLWEWPLIQSDLCSTSDTDTDSRRQPV